MNGHGDMRAGAARPARDISAARSVMVRFVASGAAAALVFLSLSYALTAGGLPPFLGSLLAYGVAFGFGYALQQRWTFGARHAHAEALPRYFALQAGCAGLSGLVSQLATDVGGCSPLAASVLTTIVVGATSFILSRYWVFADGRSSSQ